jgi:hypothetical protein
MHPRLIVLALMLFSTTSNAGNVCVQACNRFASCKLMTFKGCMDVCTKQGADRPSERASTLAQARMSCQALGSQMAGNQWLCVAEGASSTGHNMDGYTPDTMNTRDIFMPAQGRTRNAAANLALRNCGAIMGLQLEIGRSGSTETGITSACRITQCIAPASSARNRRQP